MVVCGMCQWVCTTGDTYPSTVHAVRVCDLTGRNVVCLQAHFCSEGSCPSHRLVSSVDRKVPRDAFVKSLVSALSAVDIPIEGGTSSTQLGRLFNNGGLLPSFEDVVNSPEVGTWWKIPVWMDGFGMKHSSWDSSNYEYTPWMSAPQSPYRDSS